MLLQLRDFIYREKIVSTQQLMREFKVDLQALLPMLQCWVNKGIIRQCVQKTACQSACFRCKKEPPLYYELFTQ
jgi:hypothetical protein